MLEVLSFICRFKICGSVLKLRECVKVEQFNLNKSLENKILHISKLNLKVCGLKLLSVYIIFAVKNRLMRIFHVQPVKPRLTRGLKKTFPAKLQFRQSINVFVVTRKKVFPTNEKKSFIFPVKVSTVSWIQSYKRKLVLKKAYLVLIP